MKSVKSVGRVIGVMLFVQMAGLIVPFALLHPLTRTDYVANAAGSALQFKVAVFLLLANCALTLGISVAGWPVFRRHSERMAILLVAAGVIMFSLQAVDNAHLMSMLSLSQQYAQAGGADGLSQTLSVVIGSARRWAHYSELLVIDAWIFVLYGLLYRFRLVPRALAVFALVTVMLHFAGITLPLWLGYGSVTLMGVPMALSHIALALWMTVRGFDEGKRALHAEPRGDELPAA
jgi:hypothetical protein